MAAIAKPFRRAGFELLASSTSEPNWVGGKYRHLAFETLEHRDLLAADVVGSGPVLLTATLGSIDDGGAVSEVGPHLTAVAVSEPEMRYDGQVGRVTVSIQADKMDDGVEFVAANLLGARKEFSLAIERVSANEARLTVDFTYMDFPGALQLNVGIHRAGDVATESWLDTRLLTLQLKNPLIDLSLSATKLDGSPLTTLRAGDEFMLHVSTEDLRKDPRGVFAAYLNLNWDSSLAQTSSEVKHPAWFGNGVFGDLSVPGEIREAGGFGGSVQPLGGRFEVFSVRMRATTAGELTFQASPARNLPAHDMLVYGQDGWVNSLAVKYGQLQLTVSEQLPTEAPQDDGEGTVPLADTPGSQAPALNPPPSLALPADWVAGNIIGVGLTATLPDGTPLGNPRVGDEFVLHLWVRDARENPRGVHTAFMSVNWDSLSADVVGNVRRDWRFSGGKATEAVHAGTIQDLGGISGMTDLTGSWLEVVSIPMRATAAGKLSFATAPASQSPAFDMLVNGIDGGIGIEQVHYGTLALDVSPLSLDGGGSETVPEKPAEPVAISEAPVISVPVVAETPVIVAINDDEEGSQFVVNLAELFSPAMQAEIVSRKAAKNVLVTSSATLLTANPSTSQINDAADPLTTTAGNPMSDLVASSRESGDVDSDADLTADQRATTKVDLAIL